MEAYNYPIAGILLHPETQTMSVHGADKKALNGKVNNADTDAIMYYFSKYINQQAKINLD